MEVILLLSTKVTYTVSYSCTATLITVSLCLFKKIILAGNVMYVNMATETVIHKMRPAMGKVPNALAFSPNRKSVFFLKCFGVTFVPLLPVVIKQKFITGEYAC